MVKRLCNTGAKSAGNSAKSGLRGSDLGLGLNSGGHRNSFAPTRHSLILVNQCAPTPPPPRENEDVIDNTVSADRSLANLFGCSATVVESVVLLPKCGTLLSTCSDAVVHFPDKQQLSRYFNFQTILCS
jgi:hypothetical protein